MARVAARAKAAEMAKIFMMDFSEELRELDAMMES